MAVHMGDLVTGVRDRWRVQPTDKRVRAEVAGVALVDTTRAVLVWAPGAVVPQLAVPVEDVRGRVTPVPGADPAGRRVRAHPDGGGPVVDGVLPADPELAGLVLLDPSGPDRWLEEDEEVRGHPRDPFHRVDLRRSSRAVRIALDGVLLARTTRPCLVFETLLPVRWYLPPEDVVVELRPSGTRTWCPYKGEAHYWSPVVGGRVVPDLVWGYPDPLPDAGQLRGLVAFFDERVDVEVDGTRRERPVTPWS